MKPVMNNTRPLPPSVRQGAPPPSLAVPTHLAHQGVQVPTTGSGSQQGLGEQVRDGGCQQGNAKAVQLLQYVQPGAGPTAGGWRCWRLQKPLQTVKQCQAPAETSYISRVISRAPVRGTRAPASRQRDEMLQGVHQGAGEAVD